MPEDIICNTVPDFSTQTFPKYEKYQGRPENYLTEPNGETIYEYARKCNGRVTKDNGDTVAFVSQDCKTRYSKLWADVDKLADYLASQGFKKGDCMTIFLPTSAHSFTSFYALTKLGIKANIVHPLTSEKELNETMKLCSSKGIFILDRFAGKYKETLKNNFTIVCSTHDYCTGLMKVLVKADDKKNSDVPVYPNVHIYEQIMKGDFPKTEAVHYDAEETKMYMHGGGTTGKSKTIQLSSRAINYLAYNLYQLDKPHDYKNSYSLGVLPTFHAFGLVGILHYPVCNGYGVLLMPKFDAKKANDMIKKYPVREILGVPLMFQKMFAEPNFVNKGIKNITVGYFSGGDFVSEEFIDNFDRVMKENGSNTMFSRGWGLTECCAVCCSNNYLYYEKGSCGHPLQGTEIEILDENHKPLPAGEVGEIAVRSTAMMNGYLPDGTIKETGIWTDENGKYWVLTGDMGHLSEGGFLYFDGRKKRIIIIAGYNVYPATIEGKLGNLEYIREVCAAQAYTSDGKPFMRLFISLKPDCGLTEQQAVDKTMKFCEENFNKFSIPREIKVIDALPRTKIEKIDFLALTEKPPKKN